MGSTPLTEGMILARSKCSDLERVTKLNCWGVGLTDIKIIQKLSNVEVLALSVNNITTIKDVQHCRSLRELYLRENKIKDISEILYLRDLPNLTHLWLADNPCANFDKYRQTVLKYLPRLHKLDDKTVSDDELQEAPHLGQTLINDEGPQENGYHDDSHLSNSRKSSFSEQVRPASVQSERYIERNYDQYDQPQETGNSSPEREAESSLDSATQAHSVSRPIHLFNSYSLDFPSPELTADRYYQAYQTPHGGDSNSNSRDNYEGNQLSTPTRSEYNYYEENSNNSQQYRNTPANSENQYTPNDNGNRNMPSVQTPNLNSSERLLPRTYPSSRPRNRNSNILSAVLCLVKELDFPSLEVVEMAVRSRMDELES